MDNQDTKILWDFNIRSDRVMEAKRPDIVLIDKNQEIFTISDAAIPEDFRVRDKDAEKISKYQDLTLEIYRMWNTKTRVILIVIGALKTESLLTSQNI